MGAYESFTKNLPPLIGLAILLLILLFVLANFGFIRPCEIPGFSGIYYAIKGQPRVALVYGDDGTGDPEQLKTLITKEAQVYPTTIRLSIVNANTLKDYQIVIVEHAKTMPTQQLRFFQEHVQSGGQLVWIGDAGTGLGENDYICEKVKFTYLIAADVPVGPNQTQESCALIEKTPETAGVGEGICGKTFGEVVMKFLEENQSIYEIATTAPYHLCRAEKNNFMVDGAQRITKCIQTLNCKIEDITEENVDGFCPYNYWDRGPSKTEGGDTVQALDFSQLALGFEFLGSGGANELFLSPTSATHPLTKGYGTQVKWAGNSNVTKVDTAGYEGFPRGTNTIMYMTLNSKNHPAIITSNPLGSINRNGLVVYYAFPLDEMIKSTGGKAGTTLINNLFSFLTC